GHIRPHKVALACEDTLWVLIARLRVHLTFSDPFGFFSTPPPLTFAGFTCLPINIFLSLI
ncbi:MAG: hypothetical protein ACI8Z9_002303, partial [Paraglaciecola sp.]